MSCNLRDCLNCNLACIPIDPYTGTAEREALCQLISGTFEYRSMDGSGNNNVNTEYGLKETQYIRKVPAVYNNDDGCTLNDLNGTRPNPRDVSNCVMNQDKSCPNSFCLSNIFWLWGQFVDHTLILTKQGTECENIPVTDPNDPLYGEIMFKRTISDPDSQNCSRQNPREQMNFLTPWLDASSVYGCTEERSNYIREFCGGRLKMDCQGLAPLNDTTQENAGTEFGPNFVFGDIRGNEHLGLAALHTLFVREHNYWANRICELCPDLSDEEIYQRAKLMVESEIQAITYNEFLPLLLGECLPTYSYDSNTNPQVSNVFATAAYRLHSMVPSKIICDVKLREIFFKSKNLIDCTVTVGSLMSAFACGQAEELDRKIIDDVRNFLFGKPGMGGKDLAALNIQRGRDHGLGSINDYLTCFGLDPVTSFADITSYATLQQKLAELYENPEDIDIWVYIQIRSGETEDYVLDPLAREIVKDGFTRIRNGDRLWYENRLSGSQLCVINNTRLSDIIRRNICECDVQDDVFLVPQICCETQCKPQTCLPCRPSSNSNSCGQSNCSQSNCGQSNCGQSSCNKCCQPSCFDPCKLCSNSNKITSTSLIYRCSYCKSNPCVCIVICDYCGCNPCACRVKPKCGPSKLIYRQQQENPLFFKHSKYSGYSNNDCYVFPNEKRTKCTSDISDLNCGYRRSNSCCDKIKSRPGCKPCQPHCRPSNCKPCKQVYVATCKCKPRC